MRELNRISFHFLTGIFALYSLGFLFFLFLPENFYRDLFINFLPYIIAAHLPLVLLYLNFHLFSSPHRKATRFMLLFFLFSLFVQSGLLIAPYFQTSKSIASNEKRELKIISANVLKSNEEYQKTLEFIEQENPDVFGLIELTEKFAQGVLPLHKSYPHQVVYPYAEGFGIGLYSKLPLIDARIELLAGGIPYIESFIQVDEQKVHLFLVHAIPPFDEKMFQFRNQSLQEIASMIDNTPTIVMGDFNLTPWSFYYQQFIDESGLVSTRDMWNGLQHSWKSWGLYLPIDHIFLSRDIRSLKYTLGQDIGSDHLPVIAELALDR